MFLEMLMHRHYRMSTDPTICNAERSPEASNSIFLHFAMHRIHWSLQHVVDRPIFDPQG